MKFVSYFIAFVLLSFFSCENPEVENFTSIELSVKDDSGLFFENEEGFWSYYYGLKGDEKKLFEFEKKYSGHKSFYSEYKKELNQKQKFDIVKKGGSDLIYLLRNEEGETEAVPQIKDEVLQKIADGLGLVYFGKDAIKFEREREIFFKDFSTEKFKKFKNGIKDNDIKIKASKNLKVNTLYSALPKEDSRHYYFRSDLRLKSRYVYSDGFLVDYWDQLEVIAELQDRFAGVWWDRVADIISVQSTAVDHANHALNNNNKANVIFNRANYLNSPLLICFKKDFSHSFEVKAWCKENNGDYVGEQYVYR
ncbi:MAG: hypothetical protein U0V04_18890 [Spirosomataceae bacterium]|jgi:hypothetical protein